MPVRGPSGARVLRAAASSFLALTVRVPASPRGIRSFNPLLTSAPSSLNCGQAAFSWALFFHLPLLNPFIPASGPGRKGDPKKAGTPTLFLHADRCKYVPEG